VKTNDHNNASRKGQQDKSARIRERILNAATSTFASNGFDGASLTRIAAEADTRHTIVLYHFGSKKKLWQEVMARIFIQLEETYGAFGTVTKDLNSLSLLKIFIRSFVQFSAHHPERMNLILNEFRANSTRLQWLTDTFIRKLHKQFDIIAERVVADGFLKPIPPAHLAHLIIGGASTFFVSRSFLRQIYDIDPLDEKVVAAHTEWLLEAILNGLRVRE
jgi:AcrR family transcriptional regulator